MLFVGLQLYFSRTVNLPVILLKNSKLKFPLKK